MQTEASTKKPTPSHYAKWREVMSAYEASGLSQQAFCEHEDHLFRQFKYYRSRFAQLAKNKEPELNLSAFVPVKVSQPTSLGLRIELGNGSCTRLS